MYILGHFEHPPYNNDTVRSAYHVRELEIFRLKQVLDIPHDPEKPKEIHLDPEWLAILKSTNHLLSLSRCPSFMPGPGGTDRWDFTVSKEDMNSILEDFGGDLSLPENFEKTVPVFDPSASTKKQPIAPPQTCTNPQTTLLCTMLELTDPNAVFLGKDNSCKIDVGEEDVEKAEGFDSDDDVDEDDTEYESEPSFIMSGSEQSFSFLSTSNADESFSSLGNPDEINIDDDDIQNISAASETSVSDEDAEFKAIMEAQKKEQLSENDENKSASTSKSSLSQSDIDDDDSELQDILAAQRKTQASSSLTGHVELALTGSEDEEPQDIVSEQKKLKESDILRPVSHSSPASSDERSDSEVVKGTLSLALSSEKYNQKRTDGGSESEDSPQSKRFKRRNQQLYESADENTS
ncbi:hypothetical protein KUTeg_002356 [Tegillarca granosa]|uniref:Lariat debranching enzyme C-terminal domain-containing protein n=1 Tax=Tegillarca granosa TaxID=220873 RepID=A0ABQ9FU42_TEGGR|nr:hypothetical protein KUTeg_002356 [Tegillarca granosa]